ncbi:hypothetical protein FRB91_009306 [Serendipita sp. 411]|nr:hypothetical protein FRB91_009306 [Serendipita sp. 411]
MQQNAAVSGGHAGARVQFPEQLPSSEIVRPPSARPLPRVGSQNRVPSMMASGTTKGTGHGDNIERVRTPSIGSSGRPEAIGLGFPSSRPLGGQGVLHSSRRRGSGQHIHRKKDSAETYDPTRYDLDDSAPHSSQAYDFQTVVTAEDQERLNKIAARKRRQQRDAQRGVERPAEMSHETSIPPLKEPLKSSVVPPRPAGVPSKSLDSQTFSADELSRDVSSLDISSPMGVILRSDSPASIPSQGTQSLAILSDSPSDDKWTERFKGSRKRLTSIIPEQQRIEAENSMDERVAHFKATAHSGTWERTRTAANQLQRRYAIIFPALAPGKKPFNPMDVMRWRREQFDRSLTLQVPEPPSREDEIERRLLSWRPHLSDLHDPQCPRYKSRIYAPWHLTALLVEQYVDSQKPRAVAPSISIQGSPGSNTSGSANDLYLSPDSTRIRGDSTEFDSNPSSSEPVPRGFNSLRRIRNSLTAVSKSVDLSGKHSSHHSRTSISNLWGHASPSSSRAHVNRLMGLTQSQPLDEQSDEGNASVKGSLSAGEKRGSGVFGVREKKKSGHLSTPDRELLILPSSEEDRSQRSGSEDGKMEQGSKSWRRPFFGRDETATVSNLRFLARVESPSPIGQKQDAELANMTSTPDPGLRQRLRVSMISRNHQARGERRKSKEEKELEWTYDQREEELQELDELIKTMNQEQYQLLLIGREYIRQVTRLKEMFGLQDFDLLSEAELRSLTDPTSRSQARSDAAAREVDFIPKLMRAAKEASRLCDKILEGKYSPPVRFDAYFPIDDDLKLDLRRLDAVGRDLDYVASVATRHVEKGIQFEDSLQSLRTALREAFAHSSLVYRELIKLEMIVASSRPIPTWKRISNRVKPMLSWGITILTWVLWFLGELGRVVDFLIPPYLKNLFGWEMLSGTWPGFIFMLHLPLFSYVLGMFGISWSFEKEGWNWIGKWIIKVAIWYLLYRIFLLLRWYAQEVRYHVLTDWLESDDRTSSLASSPRDWLERRWYGLLLLSGPLLLWTVAHSLASLLL